jgi:hypothetical protein
MLLTHSVPPNATEGWVKKVARLSGQQVDWGFIGGRIRIFAMGDLDKVLLTMRELKTEWANLYDDALSDMRMLNWDPSDVPWQEYHTLSGVDNQPSQEES